MSHMLDLAVLLSRPAALHPARVLAATDGALVEVQWPGMAHSLACRVLHSGGTALALEPGDEVLVWFDPQAETGVVLGRIGAYAQPPQPVGDASRAAPPPDALVLEAQGDIVIRNRHARLKLGADGDIEILGTSLTSRSQRLLRLLAPMIKLN